MAGVVDIDHPSTTDVGMGAMTDSIHQQPPSNNQHR